MGATSVLAGVKNIVLCRALELKILILDCCPGYRCVVVVLTAAGTADASYVARLPAPVTDVLVLRWWLFFFDFLLYCGLQSFCLWWHLLKLWLWCEDWSWDVADWICSALTSTSLSSFVQQSASAMPSGRWHLRDVSQTGKSHGARMGDVVYPQNCPGACPCLQSAAFAMLTLVLSTRMSWVYSSTILHIPCCQQ